MNTYRFIRGVQQTTPIIYRKPQYKTTNQKKKIIIYFLRNILTWITDVDQDESYGQPGGKRYEIVFNRCHGFFRTVDQKSPSVMYCRKLFMRLHTNLRL